MSAGRAPEERGTMPREVELKLALPLAAAAAVHSHPLLHGSARPQWLLSTYYDTPERTLRRRGIALRVRQMGADRVQTVKCGGRAGGGQADRAEWEQSWSGRFDFSHIDDASAAEVLRACAARLEAVFVTDFTRQTYSFRESGVAIQVMLDVGCVRCGTSCEPLCELELELDSGSHRDLFDLALRLGETLPVWPERRSKAERGYRLCAPGAEIEERTPALYAAQPAFGAFGELALAEVDAWQEGVRLAEHDTKEGVHQVRVALRRLRSLLRLFAPLLPEGFSKRWCGRLGNLARELGAARELDVLCDELLAPLVAKRHEAAWCAALSRRLEWERMVARNEVCELLAPPRQGRAMLEFLAALCTVIAAAVSAPTPLGDFAVARMSGLRRRFRRRLQSLPTTAAEPWHRLRIAAKQLRYGLEFFAPLWSGKAGANYRRRLARIQAELGRIQDLEAAVQRLRQLAVNAPECRVGAARLARHYAKAASVWRHDALRQARKLLAERSPWKRPAHAGR